MGVKVRQIRKKADGTPIWGLRIDHAGKRKTVSIGSKKAADAARIKVEASLAAGVLQIKHAAPSFLIIAQEWLELVKVSRSVSTYERYSGLVKLHLKPLDEPIDKITRGQIRSFLLEKYNKGASKASVDLMNTVISGIFQHAYDDEVIEKNPANLLMKQLGLRDEKKEMNPFSAKEFQRIIQITEKPFKDFFVIAYYTGARSGEITALEWSDINFKEKSITINKTARRNIVRNSTKTYMVRSVEASDILLAYLKDMKKNRRGHIFKMPDGNFIPAQSLRNNLKSACGKLNIPLRTVHDIRHTTASTLLSRGADIIYVSKLLGHSSPKITLEKYSHFMPSESKRFVDILDDIAI